jgi:hypothetical protein
MLAHWDVCTKMPANYQFDGDDEQQLCISRKEYAAVPKKHKATAEKQQRLRDVRRSMRALKLSFGSCCCDGGFNAT